MLFDGHLRLSTNPTLGFVALEGRLEAMAVGRITVVDWTEIGERVIVTSLLVVDRIGPALATEMAHRAVGLPREGLELAPIRGQALKPI